MYLPWYTAELLMICKIKLILLPACNITPSMQYRTISFSARYSSKSSLSCGIQYQYVRIGNSENVSDCMNYLKKDTYLYCMQKMLLLLWRWTYWQHSYTQMRVGFTRLNCYLLRLNVVLFPLSS